MLVLVSLALHALCIATSPASPDLTTSETTRSSQPTTCWYTTCGEYAGGCRAFPSPTSSTLDPATRAYHPLAAFFFTEEGLRDSGIAEGITKFFERYAECGLSTALNVMLPRRDAVATFECLDRNCVRNFTLYSVDELFVRWGEFTHVASRTIAYAKLVENDTPKRQRVFYAFTNINCSMANSRIYPDLCRNTLPKNIFDFLGTDITIHLIWLTVEKLKGCLDVSTQFFNDIDFLKIHEFNNSDAFPTVLDGQCVARSSTTAAPTRDGVPPLVVVAVCVASVVVVLVLAFAVMYYCGCRPKPFSMDNSAEHIGSGELEIVYDHLIGAGAVANVFKGRFSAHPVDPPKEVAVKVVRKRTQINRDHFLREVELMEGLGSHTHIVKFIARVDHPSGPVIVLEHCANGDLLTHLRRLGVFAKKGISSLKERISDVCCDPSPLSVEQLVIFCYQVTDGMAFLSSKNYIHRDLAARNVLLTANLVAKIADFGLSRYSDSDLYEAYQEVGLPVRWMAPEALRKAEFSSRSDVWSFGVFAYEVFSGGAVPYASIPHGQLQERLDSVERLEQPDLCSADM